MNIIQIFKQFPTQKSCIKHLEKLRWGKTPVCVYCGSTNTNLLKKRKPPPLQRMPQVFQRNSRDNISRHACTITKMVLTY
jgi:hypothetical protein